MRITGGLARGIILDVPKKGEVRPATDFIRECIFGRLATAIQGAYVLDCFAGTGAYGLEALSRGAQYTCFLEKDSKVLICHNIYFEQGHFHFDSIGSTYNRRKRLTKSFTLMAIYLIHK